MRNCSGCLGADPDRHRCLRVDTSQPLMPYGLCPNCKAALIDTPKPWKQRTTCGVYISEYECGSKYVVLYYHNGQYAGALVSSSMACLDPHVLCNDEDVI